MATVPETRYAKSGDFNVAYQVVGTGPIDLVYAPGWIANVEYAWEEPALARFLTRLASFSRLILFDKRGTGLSDRVADDELPTLEQRMDDVRAVMDAVGSERAALFGASDAAGLCTLFAARYPQRTRALVTYGGFARRLRAPDYPWGYTFEERERLYEQVEREWGGPVQLADLAPSVAGDARFAAWWASFLRRSASPKAAVTLLRMNTFIDLRDVLPAVRVPTLVLYRRGDRDSSIEEGRYVAARIHGAKLVELPGEDHLWWTGNSDEVLDEIEAFLTGVRRNPTPALAVANTEMAGALGGIMAALARAPDVLPEPSEVLHFRIVGKLGEGGMGSVYKARDDKLGRHVAIKRMAARIGSDETARHRFRTEARAASALNHPAIVTIHAIEEVAGVAYIVMELVEGEPLDHVIARGPMDAARVAALGAEVADALDHAHEAGLVHRDIKPANVIVATNGRAKVLDFGIAKAMAGSRMDGAATEAPLTEEGTIVGTLPYMSPEQLAGAPLDGRADVFSLGCVLYEMATGVRAFDAQDRLELVQRLVARDPPPPSARVPSVPRELDAIVMRAIAKTPGARFARARDLAAALRSLAVQVRVLESIARRGER